MPTEQPAERSQASESAPKGKKLQAVAAAVMTTTAQAKMKKTRPVIYDNV